MTAPELTTPDVHNSNLPNSLMCVLSGGGK